MYAIRSYYVDILEQHGDPNEAYKYLAISTFQQNCVITSYSIHYTKLYDYYYCNGRWDRCFGATAIGGAFYDG